MAGRQKRSRQQKGIGPPVPLLFVFGRRPHAQERPRTKVSKAGEAYHFTPEATFKYERWISEQAQEQHAIPEPFTDDLAVIINLRLPHRRHGDIDNIVKSIFDGLQPKWKNGEIVRPGIFRNDKCIKKLSIEFFYDGSMDDSCSEVIIYKHKARPWANRIGRSVVHLWENLCDWIGGS